MSPEGKTPKSVRRKAAGVGDLPVPAPEIISTVRSIEVPMKIYRCNIANGSTAQKFKLSSGY